MNSVTTITITLTPAEAVFVVIAQTLTIMAFSVWMDWRRRTGITEARQAAASRIANIEKLLVEERRQRHEAEQAASVRLDFLMDYVRERDSGPGGANSVQEIDMFRTLSDRFTLEEVQPIAMELGMSWDNIGGDTLDAKAANLIKAARDRKKSGKLAQIIKRLRPD